MRSVAKFCCDAIMAAAAVAILFVPHASDGKVVPVHAGVDQIGAALSSVAPGDTLQLVTPRGRYVEQNPLTLPLFPLTISSADPEQKPVWITRGQRHLYATEDLVVEGVEFRGERTAEYAITVGGDRLPSLQVRDCVIADLVKDGVSARDGGISDCVIETCVFRGIGQVGVEFKTAGTIATLAVKNSTFHEMGESAISVSEGEDPVRIRVSGVTIHDTYQGISVSGVKDVVITDTILSSCRGWPVIGTDDVKLSNSCVHNAGIHVHNRGATCLSCLEADPGFHDPEAGDFSLLPESPCLWLGEGGHPIGDPRWSGEATVAASRERAIANALTWTTGVGGTVAMGLLLLTLGRWHFRKKSALAEQDRDARYRSILEHSSDGIVFVDPERRTVIEMNPALRQKLGYATNPAGLPFPALLADPDETINRMSDDPDSVGAFSGVRRFRRADGGSVDLELSANSVRSGSRSTLCFIARDVTRKIHETRQLLESENRLRHLLRSSPAILYSRSLDAPLSFTFVSESIENLLGFDMERVVSEPDFFKWQIHMEDLPRVMGEQPRVLSSGHLALEYRVQHRDGQYRWIRDEIFLIRDDTGEPVELIGSMVDVSSRIAAEHQRADAERALEVQRTMSVRADRLRSLGEMAAGIAHELNQPLVAVRGVAEHTLIGMEEGWELSEQGLAKRLRSVVEQTDRMVHIIDHIRLFARESGKPELVSADLNEIARSSTDLIDVQLRSHGIDLNIDLTEGLPRIRVNPFSLEELVLNLIINARDAVESDTSEPSRTITVRTRSGETPKGGVCLEVEDNGPGIPDDVVGRVFDPFFTTKEPDKGTGLGLSISKSIAEEFEGTLDVRTGSWGTVFTLWLPEEATDDQS